MGESFGQLAAVSAFLGGFVVTYLGALTTLTDSRRRVGFVLAIAASAAECLLLAALGWTLLSAQASGIASSQGDARLQATQQFEAGLGLTGFISQLFVVGIALLTLLIGTSGWLRSRRVGIYTATLACLMGVAAVVILTPFVTRVTP